MAHLPRLVLNRTKNHATCFLTCRGRSFVTFGSKWLRLPLSSLSCEVSCPLRGRSPSCQGHRFGRPQSHERSPESNQCGMHLLPDRVAVNLRFHFTRRRLGAYDTNRGIRLLSGSYLVSIRSHVQTGHRLVYDRTWPRNTFISRILPGCHPVSRPRRKIKSRSFKRT